MAERRLRGLQRGQPAGVVTGERRRRRHRRATVGPPAASITPPVPRLVLDPPLILLLARHRSWMRRETRVQLAYESMMAHWCWSFEPSCRGSGWTMQATAARAARRRLQTL